MITNFEMKKGTLTDFNSVRNLVCLELINAERNVKLLEEIPHVRIHDLAAIFIVVPDTEVIGSVAIVNNELMNSWAVDDVDSLFELAKKNSATILDATVNDIFYEVLNYMDKEDVCSDINTEVIKSSGKVVFKMNSYSDSKIFVATNSKKIHGSAVMLYDDLLHGFSEVIGTDFYIIPCSVHELIFVPCIGDNTNPKDIVEMVSYVNANELSEKDFLSNHIYKYHSGTDFLEMV
ncbi:DUF5688 family protein [Pseudobutyrivibrio xylanivorans]|uniref:Uncharacterized protein n=1 Tax=Pseudobutyrivibrio xylanivorans TaxID=185007 RepID=A0A5P6VT08_PSEXY|nr:DUF5688 family protein [Pseudobutyrivibrio xylanivorans]QFJ54334.1 hypothetical protein FXF36_05435 [Pseudobutyrivibrio xylanivorans]